MYILKKNIYEKYLIIYILYKIIIITVNRNSNNNNNNNKTKLIYT